MGVWDQGTDYTNWKMSGVLHVDKGVTTVGFKCKGLIIACL